MKTHFQRRYLGIPYALFMMCFVIAPVAVILYYAFTNGEGQFTVSNLLGFFTSGNTIGTLLYSTLLAFVVTALCLVIAYPVAYALAVSRIKRKNALLFLFVTPMWINFTLRVTALKEVLTVIEGNMAFYPFINTIIGMTYDFLPFMILPLYNTISKIDADLPEAAKDLGACERQVLLKINLPLSMPGIISGVTMVFLPAMTNYVILDMLYNSTYIMGSLIGSYFAAYDWHNGSMISIVLLAIIFVATMLTDKFTAQDEEGKGRTVL